VEKNQAHQKKFATHDQKQRLGKNRAHQIKQPDEKTCKKTARMKKNRARKTARKKTNRKT
jgi:hypothetical protein